MRYFARSSHLTTLLLLSVFTRRLWRNLDFLRRARGQTRLPAAPPRISILVPARDEARTITACIEALACQDYPNFEVLALDDQSSDDTGALLDTLAQQYPHLSVLHGSEAPPSGWNGKSYACQRLAEQATGEWLLFTDADTLHAPTSIAQGVAQAVQLQADLLSVFPRQLTRSWGERVVVSFVMDFLPLLAVDLSALAGSSAGRTAANGQYLLARAAAYHTVGGHNAVAQALVDDFALARRFRLNGFRVALVDGTSMLSCRMYHTTRQVWQGFSKNILLALETSSADRRFHWWGLLFAWGYACLFVNPFFLLLAAPDKRLPLLEIGWLGVLRGAVGRQFGRPWGETATTPLAAWSVMAFALGALFRRRRGQPVQWKGRDYPVAT